ncbi:MAG: mobile mystery protein B [Coriobacteriia bacterium]|nr:mobile mystery protein B [Coriobacteriia bacterium]
MIGPSDLFAGPEGSTPLGPDEITGLIPTWVATHGDLDMAERDNVTEAMIWAFRQKWTVDSLLSDESMYLLHRRMFSDVWTWAGTRRQRETSIGVAPSQIAIQLRDLLKDVRTQVATEELPWSPDEIAVRLHHRLVVIHSFPKGNGRHARLVADLLVVMLGKPRFTWGGGYLTGADEARNAYLDALRTADALWEYGPLISFARS